MKLSNAVIRKAVELILNYYSENPGKSINEVNGLSFVHYGKNYLVFDYGEKAGLGVGVSYAVHCNNGLVGFFAGNMVY